MVYSLYLRGTGLSGSWLVQGCTATQLFLTLSLAWLSDTVTAAGFGQRRLQVVVQCASWGIHV